MSRQIIGKILGWDVSATEITCGSEVHCLGVFDHIRIPGRFDSAALVWKYVEDCLNANRRPVKEGVKRPAKSTSVKFSLEVDRRFFDAFDYLRRDGSG
jgi:hypothetical protein